MNRCSRLLAVFDCVVEQIAERALQGSRLTFADNGLRLLHDNRKSGVGHVVDHAGKECREIGSATRLGHRLVAGEFQRCGDHGIHFGNGGQHLVPLGRILHIFRAKPQKRQRCAQVVRDRGEHPRSIFDEAAQTRLHGVERPRRLPHFDRAGLGHRRSIQIIAEYFGCGRERGERRRHASNDPYGDGENNDRHECHRKQELPAKRPVPPAAAR